MADEALSNNGVSAEEAAAAFQAQFDSLVIPPNIDPRLLAIWVEREQAEIDRRKEKNVKPPKQHGRPLRRLFAAYIGIGVMCIALILGIVQQKTADEILAAACVTFLIYTIVGYFTGIIAEWCVKDSVETLLRDIVRRSQEAAEGSRLQQAMSLLDEGIAEDVLDGRR